MFSIKEKDNLEGTVAVLGANGRNGIVLIHELLRQNALLEQKKNNMKKVKIRAIVRDEEEAKKAIIRRDPALYQDVEFVIADVTDLDSLRRGLSNVNYVINSTSAVSLVGYKWWFKRVPLATPFYVDYLGACNVADVCNESPLKPRLIHISSIDVEKKGYIYHLLNIFAFNLMKHKAEAEKYIRQSGCRYTIIRAGQYVDAAPGTTDIAITQGDTYSAGTSLARTDLAKLCVAALKSQRTMYTTFEAVNHGLLKASRTLDGKEVVLPQSIHDYDKLFANLIPDKIRAQQTRNMQ